MTPEKMLQRFYARHGDKYTYPTNLSDYKTGKDKIPIFCPVNNHGVFYQAIVSHMGGQGCPKCHRQKMHMVNRVSRNTWIDRFEKVHGKGAYDYSKLPQSPVADEAFPIRCVEHNVTFHQTPNSHWRQKHGCSKCGVIKQWGKRKDKVIIRGEFIRRARLTNGLGYEYINLPKEFSLNDTIGVFCSAHNKLFFCTGKEHLEGRGCPECESEKAD